MRGMAKRGRPAKGPAGERVSDYEQVTIRLPADSRRLLKAWSTVSQIPAWQLVDQLVREGVKRLEAKDRKRVEWLVEGWGERD
jgi:hypothetical protein